MKWSTVYRALPVILGSAGAAWGTMARTQSLGLAALAGLFIAVSSSALIVAFWAIRQVGRATRRPPKETTQN
jgi:hypothetical protein